MSEVTLPVGIQADIDEAFCFREDSSYQERAHDYLERYEVPRGYRDTAVQAVVTDLARRAFQAGAEGRTETEAIDDLGEIQAELLETAAKCTRAAMAIGGGSSMNSLYIIGPVTGKPEDNKPAFVAARRALKADSYTCAIPHDYIAEGTDWNTAMRISIAAMLSMEYGHKSKPAFDGIALLDGWEESEGAKIEKQLAEALGIPCRPWREYLDPAAPAASMAAAGAAQPLLALAAQ